MIIKTRYIDIFLCTCMSIFLLGIAAYAEDEPVFIGDRRELFVDNYMIQQFKGKAQLRPHQLVRRDVAMMYDQPWEGNACGYCTVFKDGDKYRMYYRAWHIPSQGQQFKPIVICYAESSDGINWNKPNLELFEFKGSKQNNIILTHCGGLGEPNDFSPFIDKNPAASTDARYKAVSQPRNKNGVMGFISPDGIHWKPIKDGFIITEPDWAFDTQNITFWSEKESQYVMYYRLVENKVRKIARAVSTDFKEWKKEGFIKFQENAGPTKVEQFYTNQIKPYYRAPHLYIGFPARYVDQGWIESTKYLPSLELRQQRSVTNSRYGSAVTDSILIASRDGQNFYRWNEAFLRPGLRTIHNWAYGDNYLAYNVTETSSTFDDSPNELSLFGTESYFTGEFSRLRRYTLRLDGFVSIYAPRDGGEVVTKPFVFSGSFLKLNFSTSVAGSILIEMQDSSGKALPGFSLRDCHLLFGDALDQVVRWKSNVNLGTFAGKATRLRIVFSEADVYAFHFADSAR